MGTEDSGTARRRDAGITIGPGGEPIAAEENGSAGGGVAGAGSAACEEVAPIVRKIGRQATIAVNAPNQWNLDRMATPGFPRDVLPWQLCRKVKPLPTVIPQPAAPVMPWPEL